MEIVVSAVVAVENSQPEVARLLLDVAAAILQAGQVLQRFLFVPSAVDVPQHASSSCVVLLPFLPQQTNTACTDGC